WVSPLCFYTLVYMEFKKHLPRLYYKVVFFQISLALVTGFFYLFMEEVFYLNVFWNFFMHVIIVQGTFIIMYLTLFKKINHSLQFLIAFCPFLLEAYIFLASSNGFLPGSFYYQYGVDISIIILIILFAIIPASKMRATALSLEKILFRVEKILPRIRKIKTTH
ncbi:MAG: hypothetical protein AAF518_25385, partial [Spirochaetota bacterium]